MSSAASEHDPSKTLAFVKAEWDATIEKSLSDYIRVPNISPGWDKEILTNGLMDKAINILTEWVKSQNVPGLTMRLVSEKGRTPVIFMEIPGEGKTDETIFMYGHMDKQPPLEEKNADGTGGWRDGLGPYKPVIENGRLYGRGGADDGYSTYASISAIKALMEQGVPHARIVILIEACEESGSADLPHYVALLKNEIGSPSLIICLDSGCGNYDQLWLTATLRGMLFGTLTVSVATEGTHSGGASGIVPSSFRIIRELLDRVEDSKTGKVLAKSLHCDIPPEHVAYAKATAATLGKSIPDSYPLLKGVQVMDKDLSECLLNKCWRPTVSYIGVDGIPTLDKAGNVLRPTTSLGLSFRLPPTVNPETAYAELKQLFESNPPSGAHVSFSSSKYAGGWAAPKLDAWLEKAVHKASQTFYNKDAMIWGEGGSIPFMGMLSNMFPAAQFVVTGVLGPGSNAHGPNEFLDISMFHKVTSSVASIVSDHYKVKVVKA